MNYNRIVVEEDLSKKKVTVEIANEKSANAITMEVLRELKLCFEKISNDDSIRFVILKGRGKAFSAGADLKFLTSAKKEEVYSYIKMGQDLMSMIERSSQIYIAVINGFALGGGCELALACDLRVMATEATIALPETGVGMVPGWGGTFRLSRLLGLNRAREIVLLGKTLSAIEAEQIGLVTAVADRVDIDEMVHGIINTLLRKGPLATKLAKKLLNTQYEQVQEKEREFCAQLSQEEEIKEGVQAVFEKRDPKF